MLRELIVTKETAYERVDGGGRLRLCALTDKDAYTVARVYAELTRVLRSVI